MQCNKERYNHIKELAEAEIVVDKMPMRGHIDRWCLENCDSRNIAELDNVSM